MRSRTGVAELSNPSRGSGQLENPSRLAGPLRTRAESDLTVKFHTFAKVCELTRFLHESPRYPLPTPMTQNHHVQPNPSPSPAIHQNQLDQSVNFPLLEYTSLRKDVCRSMHHRKMPVPRSPSSSTKPAEEPILAGVVQEDAPSCQLPEAPEVAKNQHPTQNRARGQERRQTVRIQERLGKQYQVPQTERKKDRK